MEMLPQRSTVTLCIPLFVLCSDNIKVPIDYVTTFRTREACICTEVPFQQVILSMIRMPTTYQNVWKGKRWKKVLSLPATNYEHWQPKQISVVDAAN